MAAIAGPVATNTPLAKVDYPTSDGKPMGETDLHRSVMVAAIETLQMHYSGQRVYVSGNLLLDRLGLGRYEPIVPVGGRLPSVELGLQLEADGHRLRFYDPAGERWLPTPQEALAQKDAALQRAEAEAERLRQELAALRRQR